MFITLIVFKKFSTKNISYKNVISLKDEAQLTSCAIACASSPIRVRVRHWQKTALLQVCLKESFPDAVSSTPLLNCQEFPPTPNGPQYTEVELPKNSLVDVSFHSEILL
jgi:hypothetical protein